MSQEHLSISGRIALLAIIGDPIAQVRAPLMINAAIAQRGRQHDAVMVPMHVQPRDLALAVAGLRSVRNFRGAIVTMPHKISIVPMLDEMTPETRQVGACNVIRRDESGVLVGGMLDGEGLVMGLMTAGYEIVGKRVLLIGAGGAAAGIAFAITKHGAASLTIRNRTLRKALELADKIKTTYPKMSVSATGVAGGPYDLVVNATSLGMNPDDPLPILLEPGHNSSVAVDIVISQEVTPFLVEAAKAGYQTHGGKFMLLAQTQMMLDFFGL